MMYDVEQSLIESVILVLSEGNSAIAAANAKFMASKHKPGSDEHNKWMAIHHKASSELTGSDASDVKYHADQHKAYADKIKDSKFHDGETHHWHKVK